MSKYLIVVESPAKAKTLKKYLGAEYEVLASYGHVRDLVPKEGAVDPSNDFVMKYDLIEKNAKHMAAICQQAKKHQIIYLATDPDREGEAISWHILEVLKEKVNLKKLKIYRVAFHEITPSSVLNAIENPRQLDLDLVNAQQARRALDYLVGFNLSPLLWKKIRVGLSAGRVQSPALRMIVERELDIKKFEKQEYWTIEAQCQKDKYVFNPRLVEFEQEKLTQFSIVDAERANQVSEALIKDAKGRLKVDKLTKSQRKRNPAAPFITSTLQQEASRKLGFTALKTMRVAQQLYEGIDIGAGSTGLISYMRTDSVNLSQDALENLRGLIKARYKAKSLPKEPKYYKTKAKNAQEAHEAIRPTDANNLPDQIKSYLSLEQYKLYNLIWQRTVASQMMHAVFDQLAIDLSSSSNNRYRMNGSVIVEPGFMQVYSEGSDDDKTQQENKEKILPPLALNEYVELIKVLPEQHFTEPPPRFSEALLVKTLEEHGIGRPSTYASIISTLQYRKYVTLENKRFVPSDVGMIVIKFLTQYFTKYLDYNFTAKLEDDLDAISRGEQKWVPLLEEFWQPFIELIKTTASNVQRKDVTHEALDEKCPKCNEPLAIRLGKRGRFIGCNAYPECDYTRSLEDTPGEEETSQVVEGRTCPKCSQELVYKRGKYGKFIGCSKYPECKFIESLNPSEDTGVTCPECKQAHMLKKKSRYGTFFYSCKRYPDCKYAIKNPPLAEPCPTCKWPILTHKTTKRRGEEKACPVKECDYLIPYSEK